MILSLCEKVNFSVTHLTLRSEIDVPLAINFFKKLLLRVHLFKFPRLLIYEKFPHRTFEFFFKKAFQFSLDCSQFHHGIECLS